MVPRAVSQGAPLRPRAYRFYVCVVEAVRSSRYEHAQLRQVELVLLADAVEPVQVEQPGGTRGQPSGEARRGEQARPAPRSR